jgi:ribonuclease R
MDREAFCRGTSTYLPGIVFPMFHETISNGVCSLKKGVNRKTITCEMLVDKQGKSSNCRIYPSMNRIACRLTYSAVDQFFETGSVKAPGQFPELPDLLAVFREVASLLRHKRHQMGSIDFQLPEARFIFGTDHQVQNIEKRYQSEAMRVIEQMMLLANENVALFCQRKKLPIAWRNHPQPLPDKRKELMRLFWNRKVKLSSLNSGKDYNKAIKIIQRSEEKDFLEVAMLRSMALAVYETENRGHFGLSSTHYCHFTSPIRRYPDLLVHRALKRHFQGEVPVKIPDQITATASGRERLAVSAERSAGKYFKLVFMSNRIGEVFQAKISGLIKKGIFVEIESPFVEGFVPITMIYDDNYALDEEQHCLLGRKSRKRFSIGKKMQVLLTGLDWRNLSPEFDWICWKESL